VSNGSDVVRVGRRSVRFPTTVTDAALSPNGMVLGFVDGAGNIATARLDGTGLKVLTTTDPGVLRAHPTFEDGGSEIVFSERGDDGVWRLKEVAADGHDELSAGKPDPTVAETATDGGHDTVPSATWYQPSHAQPATSVLVFEHRTKKGRVRVYLADRNQRGFGSYPLVTGRAPAVAPTGDRVASIGAAGQIYVTSLSGKRKTTQVTRGAHPSGHLAWTPDGSRIVFTTADEVESVSSTPAEPGRNPVHVVLRHPGVATLGTLSRPAVGTYADSDPVTAALAVSRAHFIDGTDLPDAEGDGYGVSQADHVTLLSATDPAAAPAAVAIAAGGAILFVRDGELDPAVRDEIVRLLSRPRGFHEHAFVDVVGTPASVPARVASEIRSLGFRVRRYAPGTPADDAARAGRGFYGAYVVVSAADLPTIASSSGSENPVLLTDGSTMPASTAATLDKMQHGKGLQPTVYAVGREAQAAVRSSWPGKRAFQIVDIGGSDSSSDSLAAVQSLYDAPGRLSVTTGTAWQDMLITSMVGPALVVGSGDSLTPSVREWLAASQPVMRGVYVLGGSPGLARAVGRAVYGDRYVVRSEPGDIIG
jgi:hypothetical protein